MDHIIVSERQPPPGAFYSFKVYFMLFVCQLFFSLLTKCPLNQKSHSKRNLTPAGISNLDREGRWLSMGPFVLL